MALLDLFWTILWVFLLAAWIWTVVSVLADVFRADTSGWAKGGWSLFIILIPWLGVLVYLIVNGGDMQRRAVATVGAYQQAQEDYIRSVAGTQVSTSDELAKLAELRDSGVISEDEFHTQKQKLLG